jgi:hypothetical protein
MLSILKSLFVFAAILVVSTMWGCASASHEAAEKDMVTVQLIATGMNAGEVGKAILLPQGDGTRVTIQVSGVGVPVTPPVELYMSIYAGKCGSLGAQPKFVMTRIVRVTTANLSAMTAAGPFSLTNTAPATLAQLRDSPHALVVKTSPADSSVEVFCGNL